MACSRLSGLQCRHLYRAQHISSKLALGSHLAVETLSEPQEERADALLMSGIGLVLDEQGIL